MRPKPSNRLIGAHELFYGERVASVLRGLDEEAKSRMLDQLLDAIATAREKEDLKPINDVIEAWYRSTLFFTEGGEELAEELREGFRQIVGGEPGATLDDVRERLHLSPEERPHHP